ncbi:MAG: bifunctional phosphopantothenoylcysteine decarboxylase/phosphopantothenate--cysteine ligase CoaBC [Armatimonadetes bacterium]|nr:bifunctional phosphopantothenoylcysteine decarboxylase/phosphopantothenate--cysteine ligase CoaBC [Armatimonadota bacterium]
MNIVLGVCGSVAAYRACDLARDLMRAGHTVRVCLTDSAAEFVSPALFEALTGHPCLSDVFEEPERGRMAHIDWARSADLILIVPATANTINKIANGIGDDMLTTIALASTAPLLAAPAMNPTMYQEDTVQASLKALDAKGVSLIEPSTGDVACGENGQGKLASNSEIFAAAQAILSRRGSLAGKTVLITSGPTQEPIDDVRYITNRSSGKMGAALAKAAHWAGAKVVFISGPTNTPLPTFAAGTRVRTTQEMHDSAVSAVQNADIVIAAAAVADYRPAQKVDGKIRRTEGNLNLELAPNPDVIKAVVAAKPEVLAIAFAAEPDDSFETAIAKMKKKGVRGIAVNDVSRPDAGFEVDTNELTLLLDNGSHVKSGHQSKLGCAVWLIDEIAKLV